MIVHVRFIPKASSSLTSGRQDNGLAGRLRVEEPVGFLVLLEPPAVREEPLHVHLALGDELGALGLALLRGRLSLFAPARRAAGEGLSAGVVRKRIRMATLVRIGS